MEKNYDSFKTKEFPKLEREVGKLKWAFQCLESLARRCLNVV